MQFAHNQAAALVTGTFAVTAVGAFYALRESHRDQARLYLKHGTVAGLAAAVLVAFPTGDRQAKMVARYQEPVLAAMEGRFETGPMAEITIIGQPNVKERRIDNPIKIPGMLSFLAYGTFHSDVRGLDAFPPETWPTNIELLYYAFHVMAGLGTIFIALMGLANLQRLRGRLEASPALLWVLMLAFPFPFIANTAGWMTTELGRQPWLIYGLFRTQDGYSDVVSSGDVLFTLIGMAGLYFVLGLLYLYLVGREILHGPDAGSEPVHVLLNRHDGGAMVEVWFGLLCFTLTVFAVLDGWNIGAGALHLIAGRTGAERREIIAAIGPFWSWHEVWLLAFGGTFLLAFPGVMATSFAGFYLALWLVLWSFILRGVSIEVGGHIHDRLWQSWWDFVFARLERAARRAVWRRARQRDPRRAARRERQVQHVALHRLRRARPGGDPRLVHPVRRGVHDGAALGAWRDLPPAQDHRPGAPAQRTSRAPVMDDRARAVSRHLAGNLGRAAGTLRGDARAAAAWLAIAVVLAGAWALVHRVARNRRAAPLRDRAR